MMQTGQATGSDDTTTRLLSREDGPELIAFKDGEGSGGLFQIGTTEKDWHSHRRGQLTGIDAGLLHVRTLHGSWLLPPYRAVWIPPDERHWGSMTGVLSGWSALIAPDACRDLPKRPQVMKASALMRALVERAADWSDKASVPDERSRIASVLLDEIKIARQERLHLPMPADVRIRKIAQMIVSNPAINRTLYEWTTDLGISARTARRLFVSETGMPFADWRQQARLVYAVEMLARHEPVAVVADALGYATPSNFIAMFRKVLGETPGQYFSRSSDISLPADID